MSGNRNKAQPKLGEGVHPPHRRPVLTLETSEAVDLTHMHEGKDPEGAHAPANDLPPVDLQPESQNTGLFHPLYHLLNASAFWACGLFLLSSLASGMEVSWMAESHSRTEPAWQKTEECNSESCELIVRHRYQRSRRPQNSSTTWRSPTSGV